MYNTACHKNVVKGCLSRGFNHATFGQESMYERRRMRLIRRYERGIDYERRRCVAAAYILAAFVRFQSCMK